MGESLQRNGKPNAGPHLSANHQAGDLSGWHLRARRTRDRLHAAFETGRISLAYQPVVGRDGNVFYHECLLRAVDPWGMALHPADFVPVMEQLGEIEWLDRLAVLLTLAELEATPRGVLGCNISGQSLSNPSWMAGTAELLSARWSLAERLVVEVAGTGANFNLAAAAESVAHLRALGVRVALDNFGVGVLSDDDLRVLDVDIVKFDRQLVGVANEDLAARDNLAALAESALGHGLLTVAEGVGDLMQICVLSGIGIRFFQGFALGKPRALPIIDRASWPHVAQRLAPSGDAAAENHGCTEKPGR